MTITTAKQDAGASAVGIQEVDARTAQEWLRQKKALLFDVREPDEYAIEHIRGARLVPLSGFNSADFPEDKGKIAIFHCGSSRRTCMAAPQLMATGFAEVYHLSGGIKGWKEAGLPVSKGKSAPPISLQRQVQIAAGGLVLAGALLSLAAPGWIWLSAFVGGGLVFAGITGTCGMATVLSRLPWNRF